MIRVQYKIGDEYVYDYDRYGISYTESPITWHYDSLFDFKK